VHGVYKTTSDVQLMCELHVTVTLFTAAFRLSDVDPYFFRIRGFPDPAVFFNSVTLQIYIAKNFSLSKE
jgi:hypothetical protein